MKYSIIGFFLFFIGALLPFGLSYFTTNEDIYFISYIYILFLSIFNFSISNILFNDTIKNIEQESSSEDDTSSNISDESIGLHGFEHFVIDNFV